MKRSALVLLLACGMLWIGILTGNTNKMANPALYVAAPGTAYHQGAEQTATAQATGSANPALYVAAPNTQYHQGAVETYNALNPSGTDTTTNDLGGSTGGITAAQQATIDGHNLFTSQLGNIDSSAGLAGSTSAGDLKNSILDYIDSLKANQTGRNNQQVQNYLAKQQGSQSISDMVGQGIRSAGVTLNNQNAGDSSAAGAIAGAYGQLGRSQLSNVGNQFAQAQNTLEQGHAADVTALGSKLRDLPQVQTDVVNKIVSDAQQQLGALDTQMAYMSLPDRVDMEAQKQQITNDVLAKLQGLDQMLSDNGNQALVPEDQNAAVQKAGSLYSAGTAPSSAFQFNNLAPTEFQNTGPFAGNLPIFTFPNSKKQTA